MKVKLKYFDVHGFYFASGEYNSVQKQHWQVCDDVQLMLRERRLPGLADGHSVHYTVLVETENPCHMPRLITR